MQIQFFGRKGGATRQSEWKEELICQLRSGDGSRNKVRTRGVDCL